MLRFSRAAGFAAAVLMGATVAWADALPMIGANGSRTVDASGKPVVLKGCNLGNYLMLESWMFGGTLLDGGEPFKDQAALLRRLRERFGDTRAEQLMNTFRESWITARDFEQVKSFGFNCVRLPFDYRLLQDDPSPDAIRPDAFRWLDHAIELAESAGVYVILDLHGVPGGQSGQDHTGESGQNQLWGNAKNQARTIAIWRAISERYKTRASVAGYDLINEPYSDYRTDVRGELATIMPRIAEAIRAGGDRHVIFFAGALNGGIAFYGDPATLKQIAFTEHYYPGLFGSKSALETHARLLGQELPAKRAYLDKLGAPYLVGEFNVVLPSEDPNRLMRAYYDRFAEYGWAATMWSYKLVKAEPGSEVGTWYAVTNGEPLAKVDVAKDAAETIEAYFKTLATSSIAPNEKLRDALTTARPAPLYLAKYAPLPEAAPTTPPVEPAGFTSSDVGGALPGHTLATKDGGIEIMAGGTDVNGTRDSFRFVAKPAAAGELRATFTSFVDSNEYAKAGVMARWGEDAGSAMAMVNVFPDGTIALISRATPGGPTTEAKLGAGVALPVQLRLQIDGGKATASYRSTRDEAWKAAGEASVPNAKDFRVGVALCAHVDNALTTAKVLLDAAGDAALPAANAPANVAGASLLKNGSFETQGKEPNLAADWNRWGDWIDRETTWSPVRDGKALIGYHHYEINGAGATAGLWQDAKVVAGKRYAFTIYAQHDVIGDAAHDAKTIELRLESVTPDGQVTLNSQSFGVAQLATDKAWSKLTVNGTATSDTIRVLAVINSADEAPRGGAIKLDTATLTPATDGK